MAGATMANITDTRCHNKSTCKYPWKPWTSNQHNSDRGWGGVGVGGWGHDKKQP